MSDARFVYIRFISDAQIKIVIKPNKYKVEARLAQIQYFNPGIYDDCIYNHLVDTTAGEVFIPRGIYQPNSQRVCVDMNYH